MTQPHTSIIVLCYNQLSVATKPCIESILRNTPVGSYELILVDNASTDGTAEYLKSIAENNSLIKLQLNSVNKGYAGGNNDGIKMANGQFIILLNNDTLVPAGWLSCLLRPFDCYPQVGLIGPVTNSAGNEQRIEIEALNEGNFEEKIQGYLDRQKDEVYFTEKLGFFCVAIRRTVIDKVGLLDESFGIGMFEDDDYCFRAKKAGFDLVIAEDSFVYHKGSLSFNKLAIKEYQALFNKNRELFRKKHDYVWTLTDIALSYLEKISIDMRKHFESECNKSPELERVISRLDNFEHLLVQIHSQEIQKYGPSHKLKNINFGIATRSKWRTRAFNFKRNIVWGTNAERRRYVMYLLKRVLFRIGLTDENVDRKKIISTLLPIKKAGLKVVVFPATVDFSYMKQRPQGLAEAFAKKGYVVLYGTLNRQSDDVKILYEISKNLYLLNEIYFSYLAEIFKADEIIYFCMWPNNIKHVDLVPHQYLIYDVMDDLDLLDLEPHLRNENHNKLMNLADLITVSSDKLMENIPKKFSHKTLLVNNGVSNDFLNLANEDSVIPFELMQLKQVKVAGYYGAIAEWMDFELIEFLLDTNPSIYFVLIGPISSAVQKKLNYLIGKYKNIIVLPERRQIDLIPYLKRFDVCMIPFIKNKITDSVSPVKLFEYFSARKPVVTTAINEAYKYEGIYISCGYNEFSDHISSALRGEDANENLRSIAMQNTWESRVEQIKRFLC